MTARGGRQRRGVQRVEMLDAPEPDQALWLREPASPADAPQRVAPSTSSGRRGRLALAAVGTVVAIFVAANLLSDTGKERRSTPPSSTALPSTTAKPTTTVATSDTVASTSGGGTTTGAFGVAAPTIVVDVPPGYVVSQVDRFQSSPDQSAGQLWATWSSDPAAATWVWLTMYPSDGSWLSSGSSRVWLHNGVGLLSTNPDGTMRLEANIPDTKVIVVAHGLPAQALAAIVDSVGVSGSGLIEVGAMQGLGLRLVASTTDAAPTVDTVMVANIAIYSTVDPSSWINVQVGQPLRTFDRALRSFLLREPQALTLGGSHLATVGIDGRTLGNDSSIAIVDVDGTEVEVTGDASRNDIIAIASSLRVGTDADWEALRSAVQQPDVSSSNSTQPVIGSGTLRTGATWQALLATQVGGPTFVTLVVDPSASGAGSTYGGGLPVGTDPVGIQPLATEAGVVLVAHAGREYQGAELRVSVADAAYHGSLADPGPGAPAAFATVGFSELAPYHAELVAPDGTVLATLDGT